MSPTEQQTMVEVKKYHLPPTALVPNSPHPLLHYTGLELSTTGPKAALYYDLFKQHGWETQWIWSYGPTQPSHYHAGTHECMVVLSGTATIRFGVEDTSADGSNHDTATEAGGGGGVEIEARAGDVFLLPAGTAHKTHDAKPENTMTLLTPGDAHTIAADDPRAALDNVHLVGFTMLGAYPRGCQWDSQRGGENEGEYDKVWSVEVPELDPVLGRSERGLCGQWSRK
jgi:uncharacterized protein YjlB